jgi:8-oxo-dGTP diphosphatase
MSLFRSWQDDTRFPVPNTVSVVVGARLPRQDLVTGAYVLAFRGHDLLMVYLGSRGWDVPGGHVEPGETALDAVRRETLEESGIEMETEHVLGYEEIVLAEIQPPGYAYPTPLSYQVFFWGTVGRLVSFDAAIDAEARAFFRPEAARALPWVKRYPELYEEALALAGAN